DQGSGTLGDPTLSLASSASARSLAVRWPQPEALHQREASPSDPAALQPVFVPIAFLACPVLAPVDRAEEAFRHQPPEARSRQATVTRRDGRAKLAGRPLLEVGR